MLGSLKMKLVVPIAGLVAVMVVMIIVFFSVVTASRTNTAAEERMAAATQAVRAYMSSLEQQTFISVMALGGSAELIRRIDEGDRLGVWQYLIDQKTLWGVTSIIVTDTEGRAFARSALRDLYGDDVSGGPSISAGLRRETVTLYMPTPTAPLVMTSAAPILERGRLVGTVAVNFDVATSGFVDRIRNTFDVDVTVFAGTTSVASTLIDPQTADRAVGLAASSDIAAEVFRDGRNAFRQEDLFGVPYRSYYFPLRGAAGNSVGMVFIGISQEQAVATNTAAVRNAFIAGILLFLIVTGMVIFFVSRILKPIRLMTMTLDEAAKGDLTKRLPEQGNDELAQASRSFNQTMEALRKMIVAIKGQTGTLDEIGSDLTDNMSKTATAMNQIAVHIHNIKGRVLNQSSSVTQTNATMEQVTANISKLSGNVERQTGAVSEAASALEQMIANIKSVTSTLVKNAANVESLKKSSDTGRNSLQEVAEDIQEIARESEGLLEINAVMENIASQTNLLSMNAAIEAAHAGDAGRGFAVVADEIRKLAESSGEQSKTIGTVLKKIAESIGKITRSTENVLNNFEAIDLGVKTVAEQEEVIQYAMEEQGQGSKQVLQASGQVGEITQQVKGEAQEMQEGSKEVIQESRNLERVTQEIANGMNEMAAGAEQVNKAVSNVSTLSGKTQENISSLVQAVSRFKV